MCEYGTNVVKFESECGVKRGTNPSTAPLQSINNSGFASTGAY